MFITLAEANIRYKFLGGYLIMSKISTSQKVLKAMRIFLDKEENKDGVTSKELWNYLESIPAIKKEVYGVTGKRREGILTGLATRIKLGQIKGIRVEKRNKHLFYIKDC